MFVNLTDVLTNEDKVISIQVESELDRMSVGGEVFPVIDRTPVELTASNIGKGRARIHGSAEFVFSMKCDRCLKPVEQKLKLVFDRDVSAPDRTDGSSEEDEEQWFMNGCQLNVDDLLNNEIVINWPMKILCKPDCKGICLKCGTDLNTGTCDCDTFVPDPRMAVIKDIFNANKEV